MSDSTERKYYGKYRGLVINNVDPLQKARLLVQVPDVLGLAISSWAMPCMPIAGPQMGVYVVPIIGAGVWVEFEGGDPDYPIWTGGFWGSAAEVPALLVPSALSNLFRPRPAKVILNLIRKEVCLHKPLFLVSAVFTVAWLLTVLLMVLRPAWHDGCVATLHGLTGTQVVLMVILGGCIALGDDSSMGGALGEDQCVQRRDVGGQRCCLIGHGPLRVAEDEPERCRFSRLAQHRSHA